MVVVVVAAVVAAVVMIVVRAVLIPIAVVLQMATPRRLTICAALLLGVILSQESW
jgi:hypothetical protein